MRTNHVKKNLISYSYKTDRVKAMKSLSVLFLSLIIFAGQCFADLPRLLNYQGKLVSVTGTPVSGIRYFKFSMYSNSNDVNPLWFEEQAITVQKGFYSVQLGSQVTFPSFLDFSIDYYLGIHVKDAVADAWDDELLPRVHVLPVPNSLAGDALRKKVEALSNASVDMKALNQYLFGGFSAADLLKTNTYVVDATGKSKESYLDIASAINAISNNKPSSATIYILPGIYVLSSPIVINTALVSGGNISILGAGVESTILIGGETTSMINVGGQSTTVSNVVLSNMKIVMQMPTNAASACISLSNVKNSRINDVDVIVFCPYTNYTLDISGVSLDAADGITVASCKIIETNANVTLSNFVGVKCNQLNNSLLSSIRISATNTNSYGTIQQGIAFVNSASNMLMGNSIYLNNRGSFYQSGGITVISGNQNYISNNFLYCTSVIQGSLTNRMYGLFNNGNQSIQRYNNIISSDIGLYSYANSCMIANNTLSGDTSDIISYGNGNSVFSNTLVHGTPTSIVTNKPSEDSSNVIASMNNLFVTTNAALPSCYFNSIGDALEYINSKKISYANIYVMPGNYIGGFSTRFGNSVVNNVNIYGENKATSKIYGLADISGNETQKVFGIHIKNISIINNPTNIIQDSWQEFYDELPYFDGSGFQIDTGYYFNRMEIYPPDFSALVAPQSTALFISNASNVSFSSVGISLQALGIQYNNVITVGGYPLSFRQSDQVSYMTYPTEIGTNIIICGNSVSASIANSDNIVFNNSDIYAKNVYGLSDKISILAITNSSHILMSNSTFYADGEANFEKNGVHENKSISNIYSKNIFKVPPSISAPSSIDGISVFNGISNFILKKANVPATQCYSIGGSYASFNGVVLSSTTKYSTVVSNTFYGGVILNNGVDCSVKDNLMYPPAP